MASTYYKISGFGSGSGGGGGVTSLNTLVGSVTIAAGSGISLNTVGNTITISNTEAGGSVTSVGLADSTGLFNITNSPVTTAGTLTLSSFKSQSQNAFLAGPSSGGAGAAAFRSIVAGDLPSAYQTVGNFTDSSGSDGITVSGGTGAVLGSGTSISQAAASATQNGYLSSANFSVFNAKQPAGNYITTLTGDVSASGPGSATSTLATVNSNVGSFTYASLTVNAKGLITAASSGTAPVTSLSAVGSSPNANAASISGNTLNLQPFSSSFPGVVSASGGGTTNFLRADGTWASPPGGGGSGTVTSVGLSTPGVVYSVSGSPVTTSGTLALNLINQSANTVLAGPTSGSAAAPSFRAITVADLPTSLGVNNYWKGHFSPSSIWAAGTTTFSNPAQVVSGTLVQDVNSNFGTVSASGTNPAITFTPVSANAVYLVIATAQLTCNLAGSICSMRLYDGTTQIATGMLQQESSSPAVNDSVTVSGIWVPNTTSAVTLSIQLAAPTGGSAYINSGYNSSNPSYGWPNPVEFTIYQMNNYAVGGSSYTFADSLVNASGTVTLKNDSASPAANSYYGTNGSSVLGFFTLPAASTTPTAFTHAEWDTNLNLSANQFISGYQTVATAGGTTTLTVASPQQTYFTGTSTQTCVLPAANTLALGQQYWINNNSTLNVTVNANGGGLVQTMLPGSWAVYTCTNNSSSAGVWDPWYTPLVSTSGSSITTITSVPSLNTVGTITTGVWNGTGTSGRSFLTSGTTYTTPSGITSNTRFKFTLVGGGGGGGGINTSNGNGSGGGGGGTAIVELTGLSASTGYTIAIGSGGSGGISTTTAATSGGNTTLTVGATTYTATGGNPGAATIDTAGGTGGGTVNATISVPGQQGFFSNAVLANSASGGGGSSGMAFGFGGSATGLSGNGANGSGYGGGGGGGKGLTANGGAGTAGCIIVEWWN